MKSALKRKSPHRELENSHMGKKDLRVSERDAQEKRRLRAERKAAGSPDYQVNIFPDLERGLPSILEEMEDMEVTRLLAETPPPSQSPPPSQLPPPSQSPPSRSEERSMDDEEWTKVQKRATPRQVPQGGQGEGKGRNEPAQNDGNRGFKIPKKSDADNRKSGDGGNRERNGGNLPPPAGGPSTYAGAAAAAAAELILWVYESQTTKVPVFFEAFAPFQEALAAALEEKICDGSFGAGSVVGLDEVAYHKKLRAFKLTCIN
jgi:hypothetical protein